MLTDKCKKKLKTILHERYGIDCRRIVQSQSHFNSFSFTLICVCGTMGFELLLTTSRQMRWPSSLRTHVILETIQPDIESDEFIDDFDFTLHIDVRNTDLINPLSQQMRNNPFINSINDINSQFSLGIDSKYYFLYTRVNLLVGMMKKDNGWLNIKTISDHPYLVGNLCSSFLHPKRQTPMTDVLFNFFIFGNAFYYSTSEKYGFLQIDKSKDSLYQIDSHHFNLFKKEAFQELYFKYSEMFDFNIESMTREELRELDIVDLLKYIEVQKMAQI